MRRSAAPSQLQGNSFKKPKFIPPGRSNPSLNEEIMKQSADIQVFEVASNKNTFLQSQNDPETGSSREINLGDNYSGKYCFEASSVGIVDPHHTDETYQVVTEFNGFVTWWVSGSNKRYYQDGIYKGQVFPYDKKRKQQSSISKETVSKK